MQVRLLDTTRKRDVRRFIQFPFDLYRGCENWCPPIRLDVGKLMDKTRHPIYRDSAGDFFLVESEGQVLGRAAVLHHSPVSRHLGKPCAFLNYFDVADDARAAQMLFDVVFDWCRSRGIALLKGPTGFTRAESKGLLVEGFEFKMPVGTNYNYPYYSGFFEAAGLRKKVDYYSGHLTVEADDVDERVHIIAEKLKARGKFEVVNFASQAEMRKYIPDIYRVNIAAFSDAPEFVPYTIEEFTAMAEDLVRILIPGLPKIIKAGDEVIGFVIAYPDISDGIRKAKGRLLPFGWIHLLQARKNSTNLVLNGVGIIPKYQGSGANAVLYSEMYKIRKEFPRFKTADNLQVADYNFRSYADMNAVGTHWGIVHRVYEIPFQGE